VGLRQNASFYVPGSLHRLRQLYLTFARLDRLDSFQTALP